MRTMQCLVRAMLFTSMVFVASVVPSPAADPVAAEDQAVDVFGKIHGGLLSRQGTVEVSIRLAEPALIEKSAKGSKRSGASLSRQQQRTHLEAIQTQQDRVAAEVARVGGREVARVSKVLNVVVVEVDASALLPLASLSEVRSIKPIARYELHLSETVPHIGAAAAQASGVTGAGVRVAVLDSGIDYTHKNLGGAGTLAAYAAAYGMGPGDPLNTTRDGLFPTAKVVEGYDFVGEVWPNGPLAPDDDPIDYGTHGTHVADIIGGRSLDGTRLGVAPDVSLYAFKVCSAVATSCSGVAILQGLDASLDPNGDDDISDAVDVVNMSLGSNYGQMADDSAAAVQNLTDYGVVVVCSAGNGGDKPYIAGSPSIAPGAISVAQTQVPSAKAFSLTFTGAGVTGAPVLVRNTASLDWAPVDVPVAGELVFGGLACDAPSVVFTGKVVLIDRGACNISSKVDRAAKAGAIGVILANNAAGDPPSFSFGGSSDGGPFMPVPTLVITQADGARIKGWLANGPVNASFGPALFTSLASSIVSTSSRGPSYTFDTIKPDIGAPGASLSAEAGTGDGQTAFGGTSGAAPMVAGAAALVLQTHPNLLPHEVKARLMNTAERDVFSNPITLPGVLAPITRIGGGEVRVDQALTVDTIAFDADSGIASLSFGYVATGGFGEPLKFKRKLLVRNVGSSARNYALAASFIDPADQASGAVSIKFAPAAVSVAAGDQAEVNVFLEVDSSKLPSWRLNSGPAGGNGELLRGHEFDGYVTVTGGDRVISVPWHILPHKAADNQVQQQALRLKRGTGSFQITNLKGSTAGMTELFALTGVSRLDYPEAPPAGSNLATPDLAAVGVRFVPQSGGLLQFAIATHDERSHANYPAEFDVFIDTTGDGDPDYVVYTTENGGFGASGQNVTVVARYPTYATVGIYFFTDADLNAQTAIMTLPMAALGVTSGQSVGFIVGSFDNYFTGSLTDLIDANGGLMTYTPAQPRFAVDSSTVSVDPRATMSVAVSHNPAGETASPSQIGMLALHRDAKPGAWWSILPVTTK